MLKMVLPNEILGNIPVVTRNYLVMSTAIMILCSLDIISPYSLYLNWTLICKEFQLWRLLTCFLFFGTFGLAFFWNSYVLIFHCSSLEETSFHRRSADFLWMLICSGTMLLGLSYFFGGSYFFSSAMINVMTYVWGRRNPSSRMNIFFFTVRAPYISWSGFSCRDYICIFFHKFIKFLLVFISPRIFTAFSVLMEWRYCDNLMGIAVGHIYYFFEDVYPLMPTSKGLRIFSTPKV
ncbi:Der1 family protein, partial [Cardiosporidium cionae]